MAGVERLQSTQRLHLHAGLRGRGPGHGGPRQGPAGCCWAGGGGGLQQKPRRKRGQGFRRLPLSVQRGAVPFQEAFLGFLALWAVAAAVKSPALQAYAIATSPEDRKGQSRALKGESENQGRLRTSVVQL